MPLKIMTAKRKIATVARFSSYCPRKFSSTEKKKVNNKDRIRKGKKEIKEKWHDMSGCCFSME